MTQIKITDTCPPYPRLGELYRALAGALDTKAGNRVVDRLAREGEYDWSVPATLRETLVTSPLRKASDDGLAKLIGQFVDHVLPSYLDLVAKIPLDGLRRNEALPLLMEHFFAPHGVALLLGIRKAFNGPDLTALLDTKQHPLAVVLDCFDKRGGRNLAKVAFPESTGTDRSDRELVARWASGTQIPDLQSIKRFTHALSNRGDAAIKEQALDLQRWMIVARALAWLEDEAPVALRDSMRRHLSRGLRQIDIGRVLSLANIKNGERFSVLTRPALMLKEDLKRTTPKALGDQARTRESLNAFQQLCEEHDPEGRTRFHLAWLRGRWHALSGQFDAALSHYEEAANLANYRAGDQQKQIVEETLVLAAFIGGHKPLLKKLKHRAIVFGLFTDPRGGDVIEEWEIGHLRQQFHRIFPAEGRFPEAPKLEGGHEHLSFLVFDEEVLAQLEPDLRKPDRVRAVHTLDGQKRRWPQLVHFSSEGRFNAVRALLEHGASVDQLDEAGASALLCAIQRAEDGGDRRTLDLLLDHSHTKATLDSATKRKRHTPLMCAVRYGEPDVVERLLALGATADRRGQVDDLTPLYRCMSSVGATRKPELMQQYLRQAVADSNPAQREVLRLSLPDVN